MTKNKIVIGNWKMNGDLMEGQDLVANICEEVKGVDNPCDIVVCPPYQILHPIHKMLEDTKINLGAQNCAIEKAGAFTGDVSPHMLKDIGVEYVILGHSERRKYHFETNYIVSKKVQSVIKEGMTAIVCVGESQKEKEDGKTIDVISKQVKFCLPKDFNENNVIIAYEPLWAIGTAVIPTSEEIKEVVEAIRDSIKTVSNENCAKNIRVVYGGSISVENASSVFEVDGVDGGLVGGASLKANDFVSIIKESNN